MTHIGQIIEAIIKEYWNSDAKTMAREVANALQSKEKDCTKKPPIGLMPFNTWYSMVAHKRLDEINAAIRRYSIADKEIPKEWMDEYAHMMDVMAEMKANDF